MVCQSCGTPFKAQRATARYCGPTCKKRAQRTRRAEAAAGSLAVVEFGPVTRATQRELSEARALDTAVGQAAVVLARLLDQAGPGHGSSVAAWCKAHRESIAAAVKSVPAQTEPDVLDRIRARVRVVRECDQEV